MASSIDFTKHYVVYGHGARDIKSHKKNITPNFTLESNYRIITLHVPGKKIYKPLVRIVLDKISKKTALINDIFNISCPIARQAVKTRFENELIQEYFIEKFQRHPEKTNEELNEINNSTIQLFDYEIDDELSESANTQSASFLDLDDLTVNSINIKTVEEFNIYRQILNKLKKN